MFGVGFRFVGSAAAEAAEAPVGATLLKTGQTTSYRTGDDGDLEAGRATNFTTLASVPLHTNGAATLNTTTARFTDTAGGSTYANNWVLDWSTWDGSTILGYYRVENGVNINWDDSIDAALGTFGTYSDCRLPNRKELENIINPELSLCLNYSPFSFGSITFWSSTTRAVTTTAAITLVTSTHNMLQQAKTSTFRYIPVRTFSLSLLNVLS